MGSVTRNGAPPAVTTAPAYQIKSGVLSAELVVDESAVREGNTLRGPNLVPSSVEERRDRAPVDVSGNR